MEESSTPPPVPPPVQPAPGFAEPPVPAPERANIDFLVPLRVDGVALLAGYLGLLSALFVFAPFAFLAGVIALRRIKEQPARTGKARAWFGIVMGLLGTIGLIWLGGMFLQRSGA